MIRYDGTLGDLIAKGKDIPKDDKEQAGGIKALR
jgi:hypothetical protein